MSLFTWLYIPRQFTLRNIKLDPRKVPSYVFQSCLKEMHSIKDEHKHSTIAERWQAVDEYFVCVSECDLSDMICTTRCVLTHLKVDEAEPQTDDTSY